MKSKTFNHPVFHCLFILLILMQGNACASSNQINQDSLPVPVTKYKGYRIELTSIEVVKKGKDWMKINCMLINTGREPVVLGSNTPSAKELVIRFDDSFGNSDLLVYEEQIRSSIIDQDIRLLAGQMRSTELKFSTQEILTAKGPSENSANNKSSEPEVLEWDPDACSDIALENLHIIKKKKYSITLGYTITNYGQGPANMLGDNKVEGDNVAIRANLSSTDKVTRGSIILGNEYLIEKVSKHGNILAPMQSYEGTIKLDISNMTRFTSYIVLELDIFNRVLECDETNNWQAIKVE